MCITIISCKKGPEDPGLSLRSRKARLEGNWIGSGIISEINNTREDKLGISFIENTRTNAGENDITINYESSNLSYTSSGTINNYIFDIDKEYNFNYAIQYTVKASYIDSSGGVVRNISREEKITNNKSGQWQFGNKYADYKNKETLVLMVTSNRTEIEVTTTTTTGNNITTQTSKSNDDKTYAIGELTEHWRIDGLRHKQMKLSRRIDSQSNSSSSIAINGATPILSEQPVLKSEGTITLNFKQ